MSLGGVDAFHRVYQPMLFEVGRADISQGYEAAFDWLRGQLRDHGDEIAGVVVEPIVQGAIGMRFHAPSLLAELRAETTRADTFLILDEVFTGFGRTGPMWAAEHASIAPDLLCTAKGLTAGTLPFSAVLTTRRIHEGFSGGRARAFLHGHTFFGNPLGAAVAREVLAVYRDERVLEHGRLVSERLRVRFDHLATLGGVQDARVLGCVAALELGQGGYLGGLGWEVHEAAILRGVYIRPLGDTLYLVPPLNTPLEAMDAMLDGFEAAICAVLHRAPRGA